MDRVAAESFIYAKASGILGKSFINSKAQALFEVKDLTELWNLLFKDPCPMVPEMLLAQEIENTAFKSFISQYTYFISLYNKPPKILIDQLAIYEAENLKVIGAALCAGKTECPKLIDLGKFEKLNVAAWPDIQKITQNTEFAWYDHVVGIHEQQHYEFLIDTQVIKHLWKSIDYVAGSEKEALRNLYKQEFEIKNIVWALRLKKNYQFKNEEIIKNLIYVTNEKSEDDPVAGSAIKILEKDLDNYDQWKKWKYSELVNSHSDGTVWTIDPAWIERKNRIKLNKMASVCFHQNPLSVVALIGWYKMKNFELSCIRTAVESLRLQMSAQDAMSIVGLSNQA